MLIQRKTRIMKTTPLQDRILTVIDSDYMSCGDIASRLRAYQMHIGNSVKSLVRKNLVLAWYNHPEAPKYIATTSILIPTPTKKQIN